MKRELLIAAFFNTPWALDAGYLATFETIVMRWQRGGDASADVMAGITADREILAARKQDAARAGQGADIAVLPVYGVMTQRGNMAGNVSGSGSASTQQIAGAFRAAMNDPSVGGILMDFDTPGGSVFGVDELASEIFNARGQKPIYGIANSLTCSAGYWVASQCDQLYGAPGSEIGSIGVFMKHDDQSKAMEADGITRTYISAGKYKTEGNPAGPLSEEAQSHLQARVDEYYSAFVKAIAKGRGVGVDAVRSDYGQGRTLTATQAKSTGMIDDIATFDDVVRKMAKDIKTSSRASPPSRLAAAQRTLAMLS